MKKSLSYLALVGIVASFGAGAVGSAPASAATLSNATRLVLDTTGGDPNGGVGEAGVGDAGGVSTTLTSSGTRWTVFESLSSDIVTGDTNGAVDVFVSNGTIVTRLSVSANGAEGGSGLNSYDPEICSTGRKVAYVTENEFDIADANGAPDVYVIDRDADEDGIFDEFSSANAVTVTSVSISYDTELEENVITSNGAYSPRFSSDCTKIAFVTDEYFDADDLNFAPDVYMNTLGSVATPAVWVSTFADGGADGGGYLPAINADGTKVTFVTDALDVVLSGGTLGGLIVSTVDPTAVTPVTSAAYASVKPNGNPSTGLIDTEYAPAISADGDCIAFKSNQGVDLLAGNTGAAEGIYLWDNRGTSPVISLISKITTGQAATSATAPRITDDCSFIAYESNDEFISAADNNNKLDVFLYDVAEGTTQLISSNAAGNSADANSSLAALDYDPTTGLGVVMITSGASNIRGAAGGTADLDVFSVPFAVEAEPTIPTPPTPQSSFISLSEPKRLVDTRGGARFGTTSVSKVSVKRVKIAGATTFDSKATGLPVSGIGAVALNVTAVEGFDDGGYGFVTAYPCDSLTTAVPNSSNLNFAGGETIPNAVIAPVSADGFVCFSVYGNTDLLVDASGYFPSGSGFSALSEPKRLVDTRGGARFGTTSTSKVSVKRVKIAGATTFDSKATGLPVSGIGAVALNVTAVEGFDDGGYGFVTAYPCDSLTTAVPNSSNLNFAGGETIPNAVIAPVSADGFVCFSVYGNTDLLVDASGYFPSGSGFSALSEPKRLVDTRGGARFGTTSTSKVSVKRVKIAGATTFDSKATGLPVSGIGAVALNVTAVEGFDDGGYGFVTAYPCDSLTTAVPNSSNLNFAGGETIPNAVIAPVSADGHVCFSVYGNTDLLVDASGYFSRVS